MHVCVCVCVCVWCVCVCVVCVCVCVCVFVVCCLSYQVTLDISCKLLENISKYRSLLFTNECPNYCLENIIKTYKKNRSDVFRCSHTIFRELIIRAC